MNIAYDRYNERIHCTVFHPGMAPENCKSRYLLPFFDEGNHQGDNDHLLTPHQHVPLSVDLHIVRYMKVQFS